MLLRHFRLNCILRVTGITITVFLLCLILLNTTFYISAFLAGLAIFLQVYDLMKYVEQNNRKLSRLIHSIHHNDFTQQFYDSRRGESFRELVTELNTVIARFSEQRRQKEEAFYFLQSFIDHAPIAMLAMDEQGHISLINRLGTEAFELKEGDAVLQMNPKWPRLAYLLLELTNGESREYRTEQAGNQVHFLIRSSQFTLYGQNQQIISIQGIRHEMENREMESWQKLMRVLTHEIMNSVTPISSLAASGRNLTRHGENPDELEHVLETIQRRSEGLLQFTRAYRSFTQTPLVRLEKVRLDELTDRCLTLLQNRLEKKKTEIVRHYHWSEPVDADPGLLEQVLINLLINSLDALENTAEPAIRIDLHRDRHRILLEITDNGPGIPADLLEQVFVPFFTTKTQGSGIGLSLSRQLMLALGGRLQISPAPSGGIKASLQIPLPHPEL